MSVSTLNVSLTNFQVQVGEISEQSFTVKSRTTQMVSSLLDQHTYMYLHVTIDSRPEPWIFSTTCYVSNSLFRSASYRMPHLRTVLQKEQSKLVCVCVLCTVVVTYSPSRTVCMGGSWEPEYVYVYLEAV